MMMRNMIPILRHKYGNKIHNYFQTDTVMRMQHTYYDEKKGEVVGPEDDCLEFVEEEDMGIIDGLELLKARAATEVG